jgi:hypothetical protein
MTRRRRGLALDGWYPLPVQLTVPEHAFPPDRWHVLSCVVLADPHGAVWHMLREAAGPTLLPMAVGPGGTAMFSPAPGEEITIDGRGVWVVWSGACLWQLELEDADGELWFVEHDKEFRVGAAHVATLARRTLAVHLADDGLLRLSWQPPRAEAPPPMSEEFAVLRRAFRF